MYKELQERTWSGANTGFSIIDPAQPRKRFKAGRRLVRRILRRRFGDTGRVCADDRHSFREHLINRA